MKEIQEIDSSGISKLFETPKKKQKNEKRYFNYKVNQSQVHSKQTPNRFDLNSSPRFQGSTQIHARGQSYIKDKLLVNSGKSYSPIIVKTQNKSESTRKKFRQVKLQKNSLFYSHGDLRDQENFKACYQEIIRRIGEGYDVQIPPPQIFQAQNNDQVKYSQLITFTLNPKNSRRLQYSEEQMTMKSVFQCLGCHAQYSKSSALGGHLSRCPQKIIHYRKLKEYYNSCDVIHEEAEEQSVNKSQKAVREIDKDSSQKKSEQNQIYHYSSELNQVSYKESCHEKIAYQNPKQIWKIDQYQSEYSQSSKKMKTIRKIKKGAFIPNKSRGWNKIVFDSKQLNN